MLHEFTSVQDLLTKEFRRRLGVNARYSLRAFARNLGLSPGELSELMRSQRGLSIRSAGKISKAFGFNSGEHKLFLNLAHAENLRRKGMTIEEGPTLIKSEPLSEEIFQLVSEWYHFAILNLIDCRGFKWEARWISQRLGISASQAMVAMDLLLRLGMVKRQSGKIVVTQDHVLTSNGVPSQAIRKYHRQILEKAIQALELQSTEERDVSGIGMAVDPKVLPRLKKEISDFQDHIIATYGRGQRREVYFLEMALFKLTQGESSES